MRFICRSLWAIQAIFLTTFSAEEALAAQRSCPTNYTETLLVPTGVTTSSTTFANIPGALLFMDHASVNNTCFIVSYSAEVKTTTQGKLRLRLFVSGSSETYSTSFDFVTGDFEGRSFTFAMPVGPGASNDVRIQWLSVKGTPVSVRKQNIAVHYQR